MSFGVSQTLVWLGFPTSSLEDLDLGVLISKMQRVTDHFTSFLQDSRALWYPVNGSSSHFPAWAVQLPPLSNQALAGHIPICGDRPGRGPEPGAG